MTNNGVAYNFMFVHYDDDGAVHLISNEEDTTKKNFKIDLELVRDFLTGKKFCRDFNIDFFFNLSKGIIKEEEQVFVDTNKTLYQIPLTSAYSNEVTVEHDLTQKCWRVKVRESAKDRLDIVSELMFFVVKKDDPHFLYRYFIIKSDDLKDADVEVKFQTDAEFNFKKISVVTLHKFNSYGIKEIV